MRGPVGNRFFVDVTAIYFQGDGGDGIARVVRKYVEQLSRREDVELVCFVYAGKNYYAVPNGSIAESRRVPRYLKWLRAAPRIRNYSLFPLYYLALAVRESFWAAKMFLLALASLVERIDRFDRGDVVVMPYVPRRASYAAHMTRCNHGAFTVAMIYDLFPLQYPDHFVPEIRAIFERGLTKHISLADLVICISRTTADHVKQYLSFNGVQKPVTFVYLGSDVQDVVANERWHARAEDQGDRGITTILSVGTLEPRKNYPYALALCDRLWSSGLDFRYVIVGREDNRGPEIARAIRQHPKSGRQLLHCRAVADLELLGLYRTSSYLLAVSIDEGFGLPCMEARRFGLPVICSDIAIFRELHPAAWFIPLDDPAKAAARIQAALRLPGSAASAAQANGHGDALITWHDSAARLLRTIAEHRSGVQSH